MMRFKIKDPITSQMYSGDSLKFEATVGLKDKQKYALVVDRLKYQLKAKRSSIPGCVTGT